MGKQGPTADSEVVDTMNTVYVQRAGGSVPVGACSAPNGTTRQLLRLPVGLTRDLKQVENGQNALEDVLVADPSFRDTGNGSTADQGVNAERLRRIREEQRGALAWSARQASPLYFGPCDQVGNVVRQLYGNVASGVNVGSFSKQTAYTHIDENPPAPEKVQEVAATSVVQSQPQTQENSAQPSSRYNSAGVAHDNSCGGNYLMGSVYNASGQLVQAVAVVYRDDLGNQNSAAAVNGSYRFSIASPDTPHNIYISLVDATGASVSDTVTVPHHEGGASDLGCHYVIWQGAN